MKLSACLITKNEERCLARGIESMKDIIDELIVVDTGSTDSTVEIAESFGAKIFHFQWIDDFAAARNYAIEQATGDWILFLDADQWFCTPGDARNLKQYLINLKLPNAYALALRELNVDRREPTVVKEQIMTCRVFRNIPACRYRRPIHEQITKPAGMLLVYDEELEVALFHDGYSLDIIEEKILRNNEILYRMLEENPHDVISHYYLGDALCTLGQWEKALSHLMEYIKSGRQESYQELGIGGILSAILAAEKAGLPASRRREILAYAHSQYPEHPTTYLLSALLDTEEKNWDGIRKNGALAVQKKQSYKNPTEVSTNFRIELYPKLHRAVAKAYEMKGDLEEAAAQYLEVLKTHPQSGGAMEGYIRVLSQGDQSAYIRQMQALYPQPSKEDLDLLLPLMRRHLPREAFLTFFEKYFAITQRVDVNFHLMLSLIGRHPQAVEGCLKSYQQWEGAEAYLYQLVGAAAMSRDDGLISAVSRKVEPAVSALLEAFRTGKPYRTMTQEESRMFMGLLAYLLQTFGSEEPVWAWAALYADPAAAMPMGILCYNQRQYEMAALFLRRALENQGLPEAARTSIHLYLTHSLYLLGDKAGAMESLEYCERSPLAIGELESFRLWISGMK